MNLSTAECGGWLPIATAPKDGTVVLGCGRYDKFPQAICWQRPSEDFDDGSHQGELNRWVYADWMLHQEAGEASPVFWRPLPPMPTPLGWEKIEYAPHNGCLYIVSDTSDECGWGLANWAEGVVRGEPRVGWWQDGFWMREQPEFWFPITSTPIAGPRP